MGGGGGGALAKDLHPNCVALTETEETGVQKIPHALNAEWNSMTNFWETQEYAMLRRNAV